MKSTSIVSSVLLTLGVVGYLVVTEYPFWKKSDDKSAKKAESSAAKRARDEERAKRKRAAEERKKAREQANAAKAADQAQPEPPAAPRRQGTKIYRVDELCDCTARPNILLETVEINDNNTILTILNNQDHDVAVYPPGDENAQFILEWRYNSNGSRPRHNLVGVEGISIYPEMSRPRSFKLIFPRIADAAKKIQLSGKGTNKLDYFKFASVALDEEIAEPEWRRFEDFKQCGFDGVKAMPAAQSKRFSAFKHPGARGHRWTATGAMAIDGSSSGQNVQVRGQRPGKGEVCLSMDRGGESCRACQEVQVKAESSVEEPDFFMKTCGGLPSRSPHWQFTVAKPVSGASYRWSVSGREMMLRGTHEKKTLMMRPAPRPGLFEITLQATYPSGQTASQTREYHNIYSCQ